MHYLTELSTAPELIRKLVPAHAEAELKGESVCIRTHATPADSSCRQWHRR